MLTVARKPLVQLVGPCKFARQCRDEYTPPILNSVLASGAMHAVAKHQRYNFNKLQRRLRRNVGRAIQTFNMIEEGDRVMVCLSGGKDSYTMLDVLRSLRRSAPVNFELIAVNLDQKQPGFPSSVLPDYLTSEGVPYHIIEQDTYSVVKRVIPEGNTLCSLCSRLRRGALYAFAATNGMTKIALGHHRDDMIETFFLNMFYGGKLKAMPPKLLSDDGKHVVIRPLAYCREQDIQAYAEQRKFPLIPCTLCGSQDQLQRKIVRGMLKTWEKQAPGRLETIFSSMQDVVVSHLVDPRLFDFVSLGTSPASPSLDWLMGERGSGAVDSTARTFTKE